MYCNTRTEVGNTVTHAHTWKNICNNNSYINYDNDTTSNKEIKSNKFAIIKFLHITPVGITYYTTKCHHTVSCISLGT